MSGLCEEEVAIKGSDRQKDIAPRRKHRRATDFDDRKSYLGSACVNEIDAEYKVLLLSLKAGVGQGKGGNVEIDAGDMGDLDPHYKLCLENLKPRGNAYVLDIVQRNGNLVVNYEAMDEDELQSAELRSHRRKHSRKNRHNLGPLDADLPNPEVKQGPRHVDGSKIELRTSDGLRQKASEKSSRNNGHNLGAEIAELPEQVVLLGMSHDKWDKTWSEVFDAFKVEGEAFFYVDKDGSRIALEKSADESSSDYDAGGSAELPLSDCEEAPKTGKKSLGTSDKVAPINQKSTGKAPDIKGSDKLPLLGSQKAHKTSKKTLGKGDIIGPSIQKSIGNTTDAAGSAKLPLVCRKRTREASKKILGVSDNKICLSSQKSIGKTPVAEGPAKFPLSSEKTAETRMETLETFDNIAPSNKKSVESSSNGFRRGAMDILAKPYDSKEHECLLREAKIRRRKLRYKETRSGKLIPYKDEEARGESYLDHHKDLKKKIKAARRKGSSHEVLYLLRALFFWLQNLCHGDEQFIPWKDEQWLEAMQKACKT